MKLIKIPKGWQLLKQRTLEKAGDRITYDDGKEWVDSDYPRWGSPVSNVVQTIRRKAHKARKAAKRKPASAPAWGLEDNGSRIYVGALRRDGKVDSIAFTVDIHGHTDNSKAAHRAECRMIVRAVNEHFKRRTSK